MSENPTDWGKQWPEEPLRTPAEQLTNWISPNEILAEAKNLMLNGHEPRSDEDWARIMNFLAYNVASEVAHEACRLMATLYDMPLTSEEVSNIVDHQLRARRCGASSGS